jgi:hypothetical protein
MIMKQAFWIGVYPGINDEKSAYITNSIKSFITNCERGV